MLAALSPSRELERSPCRPSSFSDLIWTSLPRSYGLFKAKPKHIKKNTRVYLSKNGYPWSSTEPEAVGSTLRCQESREKLVQAAEAKERNYLIGCSEKPSGLFVIALPLSFDCPTWRHTSTGLDCGLPAQAAPQPLHLIDLTVPTAQNRKPPGLLTLRPRASTASFPSHPTGQSKSSPPTPPPHRQTGLKERRNGVLPRGVARASQG